MTEIQSSKKYDLEERTAHGINENIRRNSREIKVIFDHSIFKF